MRQDLSTNSVKCTEVELFDESPSERFGDSIAARIGTDIQIGTLRWHCPSPAASLSANGLTLHSLQKFLDLESELLLTRSGKRVVVDKT